MPPSGNVIVLSRYIIGADGSINIKSGKEKIKTINEKREAKPIFDIMLPMRKIYPNPFLLQGNFKKCLTHNIYYGKEIYNYNKKEVRL
jgi:hypothetical protein